MSLAESTPVIIEAAINGINPRAPRLPEDIARDALAALEAGASVVHNHIDIPTGGPEVIAGRYLEAWRPVLAARPDALLYPTVGFAPGDVLLHNHQATAGQHLNNVVVYSPVFYRGELVAFAMVRAHWVDVGGLSTGFGAGNRA